MAANADIRRRLNDHRRRLFEDTAGDIAFLCECADVTCTRAVVLSPGEFDEARERARIVLHPGHHALDVEPAGIEAVQVELAQVELDPFEIDAAQMDPVLMDPVQMDPVQVDPVDVDPLVAEPPGPEPLQ